MLPHVRNVDSSMTCDTFFTLVNLITLIVAGKSHSLVHIDTVISQNISRTSCLKQLFHLNKNQNKITLVLRFYNVKIGHIGLSTLRKGYIMCSLQCHFF